MKRIFLVFVTATIAVIAAAQNERPTNWFIGAEGGFNVGFDGKDYISRVESHSGNGTAFDVYVGKFFNNTLGFRAGYQGLSVSDQYVDYGKLYENRYDLRQHALCRRDEEDRVFP